MEVVLGEEHALIWGGSRDEWFIQSPAAGAPLCAARELPRTLQALPGGGRGCWPRRQVVPAWGQPLRLSGGPVPKSVPKARAHR